MKGRAMDKQIGWYHVKEDREYTNYFECAAWHENVLVKAGRYPVWVSDYKENATEHGIEISGRISQVSINLPGIITSDEFGGRFCGMPISSYDNSKNAGNAGRHILSSYLFSVAESILSSPDTPWELFPEYEAKEYSFTSPLDGREIKTHGIYTSVAHCIV